MRTVMESAFNHDYQDSGKWGKVVIVDIAVGSSAVKKNGLEIDRKKTRYQCWLKVKI